METVKIAVQKSGRLKEDSIKILKESGISIKNGFDQLRVIASDFPLEVFFLRNSDITKYLLDGVVDVAIIGENMLVEKGQGIEILEKLGFSKCRVSLAVPESFDYNGVSDIKGMRIATSYPHTTKKFFSERGVPIELHYISGSVEIAPNIGLSGAIVDIVSSGGTLLKNNLKEVEVILKSEAVLAVSPKIKDTVRPILEELQFRLKTILNARQSRYILLNTPDEKLEEVIKILPVMRSPTVVPLAQKGWSSVQSVISETKFWEIIRDLKSAGAEDILVTSIEKIAP